MGNPEKIPLNPIEEGQQTPYADIDGGNVAGDSDDLVRKSVELSKLPKNASQLRLSSRQKVLLGAVMTVGVIVALVAAIWLFSKELDFRGLF